VSMVADKNMTENKYFIFMYILSEFVIEVHVVRSLFVRRQITNSVEPCFNSFKIAI
jgi:hypothetical protein